MQNADLGKQYLMIDIVANNFASVGPGASVDYTQYKPFNDKKYFHAYCPITNYTDPKDYQECWLGNDELSLPDMDTESPEVRKIWADWAKQTIVEYESK